MHSFLTGKVVVITGASSGIGLSCAHAFFQAGASLVVAARSTEKLDLLARQLQTPTQRVLPVTTDVTVEEDCKNLIDKTIEQFGRIDVLINNAGISMRAAFKDLDLSVLKRLMDVNFWGTVYCTKYALPHLLKSQGSLVGVISIAGYIGLPLRTGYSASKFAINGFLDTVRNEHLYDNLHVMIFAPGFTASNVRFAALTADGTPQGATPRQEDKMMTSEEVARRMVRGVRKRKRTVILTPLGKITVLFSKFWPTLVSKVEYNMMSKEPNSTLTPHK